MEFLGSRAAVNRQRHWNHLRLLVEHAHDARMAILHKRSGSLRGVDDLECVQRRRQRSQHLGLVHGQIDSAKLQ